MVFHDGDVEGIAGGKGGSMLDDLSGAQHVGFLHREDIVDYIQERLKRRPDPVSPVGSGIAVEDFLEHLRVGDQPLSRSNQRFDQDL